MSQLPDCINCGSDLTCTDGTLFICPMCAHEWTQAEHDTALEAEIVRDANGNELVNGDSVSVIQDIKLTGKDRIKQGTKATKLTILDQPVNDHDIEVSIDGMGRMYLKSFLVKK